MPLHHTTDPEERARAIAAREAGIVWKETGDYDAWLNTLIETEKDALRELVGSPDTLSSEEEMFR